VDKCEALHPQLCAHTALTALRLAHSGVVSADVRLLAALTSLQHLDLAGNDIGQDGVEALVALTALTYLDLSTTGAAWPPPLQALRELRLRHCVLGGSGDWQHAYVLNLSTRGGASGAGAPFECLEVLDAVGCALLEEDVRPVRGACDLLWTA
jgi:Leucine rich repeat